MAASSDFGFSEEVVVQCRSLQITPQAFDQIQFRAVRRKPDYENVISMVLQQLEDGSCTVVACVVDNQHEASLGMGFQQLAEKLTELLCILLRMHHVVRLPRPVVQCSVDTKPTIGSGGGDDRPNASKCPDLGQGWVEMLPHTHRGTADRRSLWGVTPLFYELQKGLLLVVFLRISQVPHPMLGSPIDNVGSPPSIGTSEAGSGRSWFCGPGVPAIVPASQQLKG